MIKLKYRRRFLRGTSFAADVQFGLIFSDVNCPIALVYNANFPDDHISSGTRSGSGRKQVYAKPWLSGYAKSRLLADIQRVFDAGALYLKFGGLQGKLVLVSREAHIDEKCPDRCPDRYRCPDRCRQRSDLDYEVEECAGPIRWSSRHHAEVIKHAWSILGRVGVSAAIHMN
jgi:hypothetical protein